MSPSRIAALAGAALVSTGLGLVAVSGPAQADTTVSKQVAYTCAATVLFEPDNPQPLADYPLGVSVSFAVPTLVRGGTVPQTPVAIDLAIDKDLQLSTVNLLRAKTVTGSSDDTELEVRANGTSTNYPISGLSVTDQPVEQDTDKPWVIPIKGQSPEIPVPDADSVDLLAPKTFSVNATVPSPDNPDDPNTTFTNVGLILDCTANDDAARLLSTVAIQAAPTPDPTDDPTPDPTDDPTTDPTDDPTVAPTDGVNDGGGTSGDVQPISAAASNDALPNTGAPQQLGALAALGGALVVGGAVVARRRGALIARHKA